jgi:hypothetical protein
VLVRHPGGKLVIDFDIFPRSVRFALISWLRTRIPREKQEGWDDFPYLSFLPPERPAPPETKMPFLYGRGVLKFALLVGSIAAGVGEMFGYWVQAVLPPGQPFVLDLPQFGNRQLVFRSPEDWALFAAILSMAVVVPHLMAMRILLWVTSDEDEDTPSALAVPTAPVPEGAT